MPGREAGPGAGRLAGVPAPTMKRSDLDRPLPSSLSRGCDCTAPKANPQHPLCIARTVRLQPDMSRGPRVTSSGDKLFGLLELLLVCVLLCNLPHD